MAEEKTIVLLNNSRNPLLVKNSAGDEVKVMRGEPVEVFESLAKKLMRFYGVVDASKFVRPMANEERLNAEISQLKKDLAAAKSGKKDPLKD